MLKLLDKHKKMIIMVLALVFVFALSAFVFADGGDAGTEIDVTAALGDSLGGVKDDALNAIVTVAPFGIAIMGAFLVWKYGINFFRTLSSNRG